MSEHGQSPHQPAVTIQRIRLISRTGCRLPHTITASTRSLQVFLGVSAATSITIVAEGWNPVCTLAC